MMRKGNEENRKKQIDDEVVMRGLQEFSMIPFTPGGSMGQFLCAVLARTGVSVLNSADYEYTSSISSDRQPIN